MRSSTALLERMVTIVNFIKAGGKDRGVLLDLAFSERAILEQAFGLVSAAGLKS